MFSKFGKKICVIDSILFNQNEFLTKHQFVFREKHSTIKSILDFIDKISPEIDRPSKNYSMGIFVDLFKAFDTIKHIVLIHKLEHYGIRRIALKWFMSYLLDRTKFVKIGNISSKFMSTKFGVPQGSIFTHYYFLFM